MIPKLTRLVRGRIWLILGALVFGGVFAVAIQRSDRALAEWSDVRPMGYDVNAKGQVDDLLFSPNGRTILTVLGDGTRLREVATGRVVAELAKGRVLFPTFFDNGRLLAGQVVDTTGLWVSVKVWDVATGRELASLDDRRWMDRTQNFAVAEAGPVLAIAQGPGPIEVDYRVWDGASGLHPRKFPGQLGPAFALSPDGRSLITGVQDAAFTLTEYDVATGKVLGTIEHPPNIPTMLLFAPDGRLLVGSFVAGETRLVDRKTGTSLRIPMAVRPDQLPRFAPDGRLLLGWMNLRFENRFEVVDLASNPPRISTYRDVDSVSSDGRRVATIATQEQEPDVDGLPSTVHTVGVREMPQGVSAGSIEQKWVVKSALSPDGRRVAEQVSRVESSGLGFLFDAIRPGWRPINLGPDSITVNEVKVFDVATGRRLATMPVLGGSGMPGLLTFSPDGTRLVVESPGFLDLGGAATYPWNVKVWQVPARRWWWLALGLATASALPTMAVGRWLDVRIWRRNPVAVPS